MPNTRIKRIILFLTETLILQNYNIIDTTFAYLFNNFIIKCYEEKNELLEVLYDDLELLKEFIDGGYEILTYAQICQLLSYTKDSDQYVKILSEIGNEIDLKINELAMQFAIYQNNYWKELQTFYTANPKEFSKILQ